MSIKTVRHRPYSPELAPCDFCLFLKLRGCDEGHWHAHIRGLEWGLPEVVGKVQQVHYSRRRLLRRGLEFHVCIINKGAHTKKRTGNLFNDPRWKIKLFVVAVVIVVGWFVFFYTTASQTFMGYWMPKFNSVLNVLLWLFTDLTFHGYHFDKHLIKSFVYTVIWFQVSLIQIICIQLYGFKYSYLIQIICTQLCGFKYSYQIRIICTQLYDFQYSYLIQIICT